MNKSSQILETSKTCSPLNVNSPPSYIKSWFLETVWVAMSFVRWGSMFGVPMVLLWWFYPASEARKSTCQLVVISRLWLSTCFQIFLLLFFHLYLSTRFPGCTYIFQLRLTQKQLPINAVLLFGDKSGVFYYQACFETTRWGFTCGCPRLSCSQCHFSPLHCSTAWGGDVALLNDMGPGQICRRFTVILLFLVINMF